MLFDYLFFLAIGLDWLILGLVIFGSKALFSPLPESSKKPFFLNRLSGILLFLLILLSVVKLVFGFITGFPLGNTLPSGGVSSIVLLFILEQIVFALGFIGLGIAFYLKDGFKEEFAATWAKNISGILVVSLIFDFCLTLGLYFVMLFKLFSDDIPIGELRLSYHPFSPDHYWLTAGLLLALAAYFIFYFALRHQRSGTMLTGLALSYPLLILFAGLLISAYSGSVAPDARYLLNDFAFYSAGLIWVVLLLSGVGSLLLIVLFFRKRSSLKNDLYFKYLLIRLLGVNAVSAVGFSVITLVPVLFFLYYGP